MRTESALLPGPARIESISASPPLAQCHRGRLPHRETAVRPRLWNHRRLRHDSHCSHSCKALRPHGHQVTTATTAEPKDPSTAAHGSLALSLECRSGQFRLRMALRRCRAAHRAQPRLALLSSRAAYTSRVPRTSFEVFITEPHFESDSSARTPIGSPPCSTDWHGTIGRMAMENCRTARQPCHVLR